MTVSARFSGSLLFADRPSARGQTLPASLWVLIAITVAAAGYPLARYVGLGPAPGPWAYWPTEGLLCGILFRRPYREWLGIGVAAVLTQIVVVYLLRGDLAGGATVVGASSGAAQAALGAWSVRRMQTRESPLVRPSDLVWFVLLAVTLVPLVITPLGALAYANGLGLTFRAAWWPLFVGNSLSVLLFAPPIMCWRARDGKEPWRAGVPELVACQATVLVLAVLTFSGPSSWFRIAVLPYAMFLALAWSAVRCSSSWTAISIVVLATVSSWCSARGLGPFAFAAALEQGSILALQSYLAFSAFTALLLAALTEQRRSAFVTLSLNSALQKAVLESSTSSMVLTDMDGRCVIVNRIATEAYGRPESALVGRHPSEFVDARSAQMIASHDRRVLERGEPITFDETVSDGTRTRHFLTTRFPVRDHTGEVRFIGALGRDMTLERELSARLTHARSVETLGELAAGVAHDLNNLLTVMLANAQLLRETRHLPPSDLFMLDEMKEAANQAAKLTRRLLSLGRRRPDTPVAVDVDDALRHLEPLLRAMVRGNIDLALELRATQARVLVAPQTLEQIVLNLVSNARAAIEDDGNITVETSLVRDELAANANVSRLRLVVCDNGRGIDAGTLPHVFEPFFTTRGENGGTGIGLYTVTLLVAHAGGTITASSAPGADTRFVVELPMYGALGD